MLGRILAWLRANRRTALPLMLVLLAGGSITAAVDVISGVDGHAAVPKVTYTVNTAPGDGAPTRTVEVPKPLVKTTAAALERDLHAAPSDVPAGQLEAAKQQQAQIRASEPGLPTAGASQGFKGCVTRFVVNQSSRHGVRPLVQVLHYTVSPTRPGAVAAVVALFNTPSFQASSNFVIDREGHCAYIVPIEAKAWTQAALNPVAVSYEIIDTGKEATYLDSPGYAKLRQVMQEVARRTGIPMRRGAVSNCTVVRPGIIQHADGGLCAGDHHDIEPFLLDQVIAIVSAGYGPTGSPLSAIERKINAGIAKPTGTGHSRRYWCERNTRERRLIQHLARNQKNGWARRARGRRYQLLAKPYARECHRLAKARR